MAVGNVFIHPAMERMALRRQMAAAVERLLEVVEALVCELDDGTPDADLEPSLGAGEYWDTAGLPPRVARVFGKWARGGSDDREADGDGSPTEADCEPSLASMGGTAPSRGSQLGWDAGVMPHGRWVDMEQEHDGREPTLGAPEPTTAGNLDQRRWSQGGDCGEREAFDGDDEPDLFDVVPDYAVDQRVLIDADGHMRDVSVGAS